MVTPWLGDRHVSRGIGLTKAEDPIDTISMRPMFFELSQSVVNFMTKPRAKHIEKMTRRIPGMVVPVLKGPGRLRVPEKTVASPTAPVAPAFYVGWQEGANQFPGFSLYTLLEEIPGHAQWSTVSGKTLVDAGFMLPSRETGREHARSKTHEHHNPVEPTRTAA